MLAATTRGEDTLFSLLIFTGLVWLVTRRTRIRFRAEGAFGHQSWATDKLLQAWGMLAGSGLVIGRTMSGKLIRIQRFCHCLLVGGTGSGKGVGVIITNALAYTRGSLILHDPKGDLLETVGPRLRARGDRIIDLAPFNDGSDRLNPLSLIRDGPQLVDRARALSESLVIRTGKESETHWNDRAVAVITAVLVYVLRRLEGRERSLASVQDIASDPELLRAVAGRLRDMGGLPRRLGGQVLSLFEKDGHPTREGSGVLSTVTRHLSFLDSELVTAAVSETTFDIRDLLRPGTVLFLRIDQENLEAQKGLLRAWLTTIFRELMAAGSENTSQVLALLDEASVLDGLAIIEETLVRGRSAGIRMLLAYQSDSQVQAAFSDKPSLIADNCDTQIYLGGANGVEQAERLHKMLGSFSQVLDSYGDNSSRSESNGSQGGGQTSRGESANYALHERALLRVEEVMRLPLDELLCFQRGLPSPIRAKRLSWFSDPDFNPGVKRPRKKFPLFWKVELVLAAVLLGLVVRAWWTGKGYWQKPREVQRGEGGPDNRAGARPAQDAGQFRGPAQGLVGGPEDRRGARGGDGPPGSRGVAKRDEPVPRKRGDDGHGPVRRGDAGGDRRRP